MWLPATQVMLPWNGIRFDATGQNTLAGAVMEARTPAGFRVVYPRELAVVPVPW
jgi:branched-chain amino acid transport system substrate-binding protein